MRGKACLFAPAPYLLPPTYCTLPPMSATRPTARIAACLLALACLGRAQELATGVNLTADEGFGARHHGMAITRAGFAQGADAAVNAPASMNDVDHFTFSTAHAEQFGMASFDNFALLIPWHAHGTLGFGVARYAVADVERRVETSGPVSATPDALFTTSDWMVTGSLARRLGAFDVGGSVHLLRRQLDQTGLGLRADAMMQYTFDRRFRLGTHVRGVVPSMARWESGHTEYEAPEASLFIAGRWDVPYFYGRLQAGLETPGLLQPGARSAQRLDGERGITDPVSVLRTSSVGAEFNFDFGLSLRAGFAELAPTAWASSARLGLGYSWRNIIGIDYAFAAHPYLDESHRVALQLTPAFPNFEGRNFRPRETRPRESEDPRQYDPSPYVPGRPDSGTTDPESASDEEWDYWEDELEEGELLEILEE